MKKIMKLINLGVILIIFVSLSSCSRINSQEEGANKKHNTTIYKQSDNQVSSQSKNQTITIVNKVANAKINKSVHNETKVMTQLKTKSNTKSIIHDVDYSDSFDGIKGTAVFLNSNTKEYSIYNKEIGTKRTSPCSTFKIVSTLLGLESGVINSIDSKMGYDGSKYTFEAWNKDLTLEEAFHASCVWYYKKMIDQIPKEYVQQSLNSIKYGNCDISEWGGKKRNNDKNLNGFWLESSLKISPIEQTKVVRKIFEGKTKFKQKNIKILKKIMQTDSINGYKVYGKTGTGINAKKQCVDAWYVGMIEKKSNKYYFAIRLNDPMKPDISSSNAKEIANDIIKKYY